MSKNGNRYKDDYRVDVENLDALDEIETVKFEKLNHHKKKSGKSHGHGSKSPSKKDKPED
jgi:hypothetical protein